MASGQQLADSKLPRSARLEESSAWGPGCQQPDLSGPAVLTQHTLYGLRIQTLSLRAAHFRSTRPGAVGWLRVATEPGVGPGAGAGPPLSRGFPLQMQLQRAETQAPLAAV